MDRRTFLHQTMAGAAAFASTRGMRGSDAPDLKPIRAEIEKRHDESLARLQEWIKQPSIAAENCGMNEGCELTMRYLREVGFDQVTKMPTDRHPGIFATLDAGAPRTVGLYFMYDVKQADPSEWSSPPWDAALVDKPPLGKVVVGRGAVNTKGPQATFIATLGLTFPALFRRLRLAVSATRPSRAVLPPQYRWPTATAHPVSLAPASALTGWGRRSEPKRTVSCTTCRVSLARLAPRYRCTEDR